MKPGKHYALIIVAVAILIISSSLADAAPAEKKTPIKVGIVFDLSGAFAALGAGELHAVKMFFEEKGMQVAGRKIKLIVEDGATSPHVTLSKTKKLVEMDKVHLLIIGQDTASGYAVRNYIHKAGVPTVAIALGAGHTRGLYSPYFFRVSPSTYQYSYEPAKWWYNYGFKRVIYIAVDFAPTHEIFKAYKKGLEEVGGQIVQEVWVPLGITDFGPYIPKLKVAEADAILAIVWGVSSVRFIKQWAAYGQKGTIPIIGTGTVFDEGVSLPAMGLDAEGVYSLSFSCPSTDIPENKRFVKAYQNRTGKLPFLFAYIAYMVSDIAYQSIDKINGDVEDRDKVLKSLEKVEITTPMGAKAYFDEKHGMIWDMIFMQAKKTNGEVHLFEIGRIKGVKDPVKLFP